ncbi:UDP-N-acetylmuramoyl-L-alanine--D-glutamate ligase [Leptospira santarosai str. HAI134]|uniref:UDP-N-acetylmuramoyl-L-alanine--D-glutamate ligase n=1 Tax=Leptospira santarosai TaxID=28183 RepID=UPI0002BD84BB|nr:UDP-N-acetylmuramoyl-L-alanine--D-glutamate ligase [Leptospira santarosai]EMO23606.1 UDP-N-acetylmuramoyl-L-alanine--D-glutamate ligase [Leptospira santarosai str. HAI134]KXZ25924.1 UDP-N-acetylmuramoylalanine--D-glutamate ligase [Leptospira santarosai]MDI7155917.1 UDP-N-acetylmuramoyl-L-alanine--D-glutamate ligase [Leptospira santarosai]
MNFPKSLKDLKTLVLGGGISGNSAIDFLISEGAQPILCDRNRPETISVPFFHDNTDPRSFPEISLIVKSPGISPTHPILSYAAKKKIPVFSEIDLGRFFFKGKIIGVTGTDGKSTTTSLTAHLLRKDFSDLREGGNLGTPFTSFCKKPISLAVLELSSYQLDDSNPLHLDVSVFLNLAPDHLERHTTMENYFQAKLKIADLQNENHFLIVSEKIKERILNLASFRCKLLSFGRTSASDAFLDENSSKIGTSKFVYDISGFHLPGTHNGENLAASILAAEAIGGKPESIQAQIPLFKGLPHRFQIAGEKQGISFINDSKSTNLHSMLAGMSTWKNLDRTCLILGGRPKQEDPRPLYDFLNRKIGCVVLIGEARSFWEEGIRNAIGEKLFSVESLNEAFEIFKKGNIVSETSRPSNRKIRLTNSAEITSVVFSPACASFDQYKNFEERGNHFLFLVEDFLKTKD